MDSVVIWRIVFAVAFVFAIVMCVLRSSSGREAAWDALRDRA